jgi:hypothetical protein
MKAKPPNLTLARREHIASAADNVRLPTKRVATGPQQADHGPTGPENPGNVGLHLYGRALDVHFGNKLAAAMKAARAMQRGGVGWYPHSDYMHIDTGPVRNWDFNNKKDHGTVLVGNRKIEFDKKGRVLVAKGNSVSAKTPTVLRGEGPLSIRDRLARLRKIARPGYLARAK